MVKVGETHEWRIISMEPHEHRLGLSLKPPSTKKEERKELVEKEEIKKEVEEKIKEKEGEKTDEQKME
jgi:ribosomal protein S1